jgi:hypothetical protein
MTTKNSPQSWGTSCTITPLWGFCVLHKREMSLHLSQHFLQEQLDRQAKPFDFTVVSWGWIGELTGCMLSPWSSFVFGVEAPLTVELIVTLQA